MNIAGLVGFCMAGGVLFFAIHGAGKDHSIFMNEHAIILVLGGTLTVGFISFPIKKLWAGFKIVIKKTLALEKMNYLSTIKEIVILADTYRTNPKKCLELIGKGTHPFLGDGIKLMVENGFHGEDLEDILANALKGKKKRDQDEVKIWMTISRFPPAFGLLGATLGMISLLQTLGEPGAQDRIGPAMAVALVATFYGLAFANLVFIPIAERLNEVAQTDVVMRTIIKDGLLLISQKKHPSYIEEYLKQFLAPGQRKVEMLDGAGAGSGKKAA